MAKPPKKILKYVGDDGELRLPVDEYLDGRRRILPERVESLPRSYALEINPPKNTKPWRRLVGDEHRYISQFEDEVAPVNIVVHPSQPVLANHSSVRLSRPWRRLVGDEHRYISQFEDEVAPVNIVVHPSQPATAHQSGTRVTRPWRRLVGDEHRYISRFEDDLVTVSRGKSLISNRQRRKITSLVIIGLVPIFLAVMGASLWFLVIYELVAWITWGFYGLGNNGKR